jgi:hypothetical protein
VAAFVDGLGRNCARDLVIHAQPSTVTVSGVPARIPATRAILMDGLGAFVDPDGKKSHLLLHRSQISAEGHDRALY